MSVEVQSLTKIYGTQRAVDDISFELGKGEIVGFLGPNGAGKSTTMKMITTYLPPSEGTASVCGFDIQKQPMEVRRRIGYLPEANPLYYEMYVREYLLFSARIHGLAHPERRINEMIERTGLISESHKKISALSKGYKQRVGLAQALLHDPEVLILDEPTSGLDPNQIVEIRQLIAEVGKEKTVLLSTHIMQEVQALCHRVVIIHNGQLVANDRLETLRDRTATHNQILVVLDKKMDQGELKKIPFVRKVEKASEANGWRLFTDKQNDLRRALMKWAVEKDVVIHTVREETNSLEDVFRNLTITQKTT